MHQLVQSIPTFQLTSKHLGSCSELNFGSSLHEFIAYYDFVRSKSQQQVPVFWMTQQIAQDMGDEHINDLLTTENLLQNDELIDDDEILFEEIIEEEYFIETTNYPSAANITLFFIDNDTEVCVTLTKKLPSFLEMISHVQSVKEVLKIQ